MNVTQQLTDKPTRLLTGKQSGATAFRNVGTQVAYLSDVTDVTPLAFPVFPGDVATWQGGVPCYAVCGGGLSTLLVISDSLGDTVGLGGVVLQPGTQVALQAGTQVALQAGTAVGITGNVPVQGTIPSQTVASGATSTVTALATNGSTGTFTATVIPSGSHIIELHGGLLSGVCTTLGPTAQIIRSDTGANLISPVTPKVANTLVVVTKDFQGARIPAGVAVQIQSTGAGFGPTIDIVADLTYNLIN